MAAQQGPVPLPMWYLKHALSSGLGFLPALSRRHRARCSALARSAAVCVGPEVARVRAVLLARELDGGIDVAFGERDEGVALVVAVVHVEGRVVLLDEVLLQHQAFGLVVHDDVVEACHLTHHQGDLLALVLAQHVLAHAGA